MNCDPNGKTNKPTFYPNYIKGKRDKLGKELGSPEAELFVRPFQRTIH